jgi:hypothetical protein
MLKPAHIIAQRSSSKGKCSPRRQLLTKTILTLFSPEFASGGLDRRRQGLIELLQQWRATQTVFLPPGVRNPSKSAPNPPPPLPTARHSLAITSVLDEKTSTEYIVPQPARAGRTLCHVSYAKTRITQYFTDVLDETLQINFLEVSVDNWWGSERHRSVYVMRWNDETITGHD